MMQLGCNAMKSYGFNCGIHQINKSAPTQLENIVGMHNANPVMPYVPIFQEQ